MKEENSKEIVETLDKIFEKNQKVLDNTKCFNKRKVSKIDLEIALTVLLVDLASCDQNFDQQEYIIISKALKEMFGTSKSEVSNLVNQAELVLKNYRGSTSFIETLRDNLDNEEKALVVNIIDDIIAADGVEDGFETYLRAKFTDMLGVEKAA